MFKNYYLFQQQISEIRPQLNGSIIHSVYSVHKNELIFDLQKENEQSQLILSIHQSRPYILATKHINYKGDRFNAFEMLCGEVINNVEILTNNKYIRMELPNYSVHAFFYSNSPNCLVYDNDGQLLESFKSLKNQSIVSIPNIETSSTDNSQIRNIILSARGLSLRELFREIFPAANNQMLNEACNRLQSRADTAISTLDTKNIAEVCIAFKDEILSGKAYILRQNDAARYLLLYHSTLYKEPEFETEVFNSVNKAWNIFTRENKKHSEFEKLYAPMVKAIHKRKHVLQTTLSNLAEAEDIESRKQEADLKGNLIIANKHKIPREAKSVELPNIFSEQQEIIRIKLNPKKTSMENATYYFQKYKNIADKKQVIRVKKDTTTRELQELSVIEQRITKAGIKDLFKIKEDLEAMNVLQAPVVKEKTKQSLKYAFKRLILDNAWDIYIGKNSQNNEQLTFEFANKWDVWLHAQGVSGSHVIIKLPSKNITTPRHILEKAAQIAAFNSKSKHSSTVGVIYTQVRYVSKIRGAAPGTVNVKNEKVIFVKPLNLNQ